jgi:hypothetical protein
MGLNPRNPTKMSRTRERGHIHTMVSDNSSVYTKNVGLANNFFVKLKPLTQRVRVPFAKAWVPLNPQTSHTWCEGSLNKVEGSSQQS